MFVQNWINLWFTVSDARLALSLRWANACRPFTLKFKKNSSWYRYTLIEFLKFQPLALIQICCCMSLHCLYIVSGQHPSLSRASVYANHPALIYHFTLCEHISLQKRHLILIIRCVVVHRLILSLLKKIKAKHSSTFIIYYGQTLQFSMSIWMSQLRVNDIYF